MFLESIDLNILFLFLDDILSLDEVFEVFNEMEFFGLGLLMNVFLIMLLIYVIDDLFYFYNFDDLYQVFVDYVLSFDFCKLFQSFNFGFLNGFEILICGLVIVVRRLCGLLLKLRFDYLNFVFVCFFNNVLIEMEDVV